MLEEGRVIPLRKWFAAPFRLAAAIWRSFRYWLAGRPVIAPTYERQRRKAICDYCHHNQGDICDVCACIIDAKIYLSAEQCPDSPARWLRLGFPNE